jgi:hypothetical protein
MTVIEARPSPGMRPNDHRAADQPKLISPPTTSPATTSPATDLPATGSPATGSPATGSPATGSPATGSPATGSPATDRLTPSRAPTPEPHLRPTLLRRGQLVALAVGTFLLPWCVLLGLTLPPTAAAQHWSLAWAGLDGAEALAALATAVLLRRADPRAGLAAVAGGTLLLVDAWFDVCTSAPGLGHALALAEACCLELPLAAAAFYLALRVVRGLAATASVEHRCS